MKKLICTEHVFAKLQSPDDPLKDKWEKSEVNKFKKKCDSIDPISRPETSSLLRTPYITLGGEKCCLCKSDLVSNRDKLDVTGYVIKGRFASSEGKRIGVIVGLVFPNFATRWYDVMSAKGSPIRLLSLPIQPVEYRPIEVTRYGEYYPPTACSICAKSSVRSNTMCLFETAAALGAGEPSLIIPPRKPV